ncbi:MAG: HAMP domain-containing histidine kinase, partial [Sulfurovum sp.]|nr:HAMP domain-containing histidine kinase [Sulfurovum sp.]
LNETLETRVKDQVEELERRYAFIVQQARLASMGEMINNIAHQWRQPLNRVNANVAVIISILESDNIDHNMMLSEAELIEKNTKYMSETIEDFAYYFHPEKEAVQFSLEEITQSVLGLINTRLENIDINIISSTPVEVYSFAKEYRQVLLVILNNAIDNFESKAIDSPKIDIVIKEEEEKAYLSICDNGGGIEEKDIGRIFDPYYTTKFAEEGTGLGLYVAKMLIESSMQGKLNATNKNSGACFEIIIPPSTRIEINE